VDILESDLGAMKIFFLLNPSKSKDLWDIREACGQAAKQAGWTARFGQVDRTQPRSTAHLLNQATEEDCSRIVVVGGDGTMNRVINDLSKSKRLKHHELAIVPEGTCNDFARFIGLHTGQRTDALRIACWGKPRSIDLGTVNGVLFLNNAGFGRHPTSGGGRRVGPLSTLRGFQPINLKARWPKGSIEGLFFMGMASNGPYFSKGLHFSRTCRPDDGLLEFFLLPAMRKWRLVPLLAAGRLGRALRSRHLVALKVDRLDIESASDLWPQVDGEPLMPASRRLTFGVSTEKAMIVWSEKKTEVMPDLQTGMDATTHVASLS
jgi:diacylglycerol kinase family enzyme